MALNVGDYRISLDTRDPQANLYFVSHAHSDHTSGVRKSHRILCSEITRDLVEQRVKYSIDLAPLPSGARMLNSGHMFGSRQLLLEPENGSTILYTGDYQMQKSPAAEEIEISHADIVIMDSTYPFVNVTFDDREEVIASIQSYIRDKGRFGSILFGAYAMGKAQELVRICNDMGISPLVDTGVARMNRVYSNHGMRLDYTVRDLAAGVGERDFYETVWIASTHNMEKVKQYVADLNNRIFTAVATGFAKMMRFGTDVQFALSDHADFSQALQYLEICEPKYVYTCGSGAATFAKNLKAHGYEAAPSKLTTNVASLLAGYSKN
jgi:Cft2 family RNA processing exonuclease